jgi:Domain of unknown function (DUF4338)
MNKFWDIGEETKKPGFDFEKEKQALIDNLDFLFAMSVEEQTLYKKWLEWNQDMRASYASLPALHSQYDKIWKPKDIFDKEKTIKEIEELQPYVQIVEDEDESTKWTYMRKLISSMEFTPNPGRNVKGYVKDRVSGKVLGVISLGSDVTSLGVRDEYIGWTKEDKFEKGKLNYTAIGTSIIATQPLGYNFLGGKLVSALTTSPTFRDYWKKKYNNTLIAVGTTSLYGIHSQYNGIPHFKTLGESKGKISIKPDDSVYEPWHQWLKQNRADWYAEEITEERYDEQQRRGPVSGIKQKILTQIFKECGIKPQDYHHGFKRGVYFAMMYENGNEFLCDKIGEDKLILKEKFIEGDEYTIRWWKRQCVKRYTKLHDEGRIKDETLFYADAIGLTWEQMKEKYLGDVGR